MLFGRVKPGAAIESYHCKCFSILTLLRVVDNSSDRPWKILFIFGDQISEDDRREPALDQQAHEIAKWLLQSYLSYYL